MYRNASEKRRDVRCRVGAHDVADNDPPQYPNRNSFGTAHAITKADENRPVDDIAHADVRNRHILENGSIDRFQSQPPATVEHAIRNSDALETSIRFGAELDAAIPRNFGVCRKWLPAAVE